jgi:hypothetical protein
MIIVFGALVVAVAVLALVLGMVVGSFGLLYGGLVVAGAGLALLLLTRFVGRSNQAEPPAAPAPSPHPGSPLDPGVGEETADPAFAFPIARYDSLWVTQIVPQLAALSADELAVVAARERGGRHRTGVLDAIDAIGRGEDPATTDPLASSVPPAPIAGPRAAPVPVTGPVDTVESEGENLPSGDDDDVFEHDELAERAPLVATRGTSSSRVPTFLGRLARPIHVRRS